MIAARCPFAVFRIALAPYGVPSSKQKRTPCGIERLFTGEANFRTPRLFGCPSENENCWEPKAYAKMVNVWLGINAGSPICDFLVVVPNVTNEDELFSCAVK